MATIKKAYAAIAELLQANVDAVVGDILPEALALMTAKTGGGGSHATTFHRDAEGNVVAIRCYYHGLWMDPRVVEFGGKATSATGFNSMCKDGVSKWTKQQRDLKKGRDELLEKVAAGEIEPTAIAEEMVNLEEAAKVVIPREDGYGFETLEECLEDSATRGL